jgi:hypothetical protein
MKTQTHPLPLKTPVAARELGITYNVLVGLIRFRKLNPLPEKDSSGYYIWFKEDLDRAREAIAKQHKPMRSATPCPSPQTINAH